MFCNKTIHFRAVLVRRLYEFEGSIVDTGNGERIGLDASALLLRGCRLRKTQWVVGMVAFAGVDTKIQRNGTKAPRKVTPLYPPLSQQLNIIRSCALL
jgi:magnesium-transporting ATPase (P-type)